MSDLNHDSGWRAEAQQVARDLDRNDLQSAQEAMRADLMQLQNNPRAQQQFVQMVDQYDRKGAGLDINISRGPRGEQVWQITDPYPAPPPRRPDVVIVQPQRPSPGEIMVESIFTGVATGVGIRIGQEIFGGRDRHHHHHHHHDRRRR